MLGVRPRPQGDPPACGGRHLPSTARPARSRKSPGSGGCSSAARSGARRAIPRAAATGFGRGDRPRGRTSHHRRGDLYRELRQPGRRLSPAASGGSRAGSSTRPCLDRPGSPASMAATCRTSRYTPDLRPRPRARRRPPDADGSRLFPGPVFVQREPAPLRPTPPSSGYFPGVARRLATRLRGTAGYGLAHSKPGQSGTPATLLRTGRS